MDIHNKVPIHTDGAPAALGPYSQGVSYGGLVFTSGQIPIDSATGLLETGDARLAALRCLENTAAILRAAGSDIDKILKITVCLADMSDFDAMNEAFSAFFAGAAPPARTCFQAAALPRGARMEIEAIAYK